MSFDRTAIQYLIVLCLIIGGLLYIFFSRDTFSEKGTETSASTILDTSEAFYTDRNGEKVTLSSFVGRPLIVNSWASWCPFCVHELPMFEEIGEQYKDTELVVVAINRAEARNTFDAFIEYVGNPEHIIFLYDEADTFYTSIGGFAMPETLFFDREGKLISHVRGALSKEAIIEQIEIVIKD